MAINYKGPKRGYTLTSDDVLWLARGFVGEAGTDITREEASYHFWCWLERFLLMNGLWHAEKKSFGWLVEWHSQALSPLWLEDGSKCKGQPQTGDCAPERLARRKALRAAQPSELSRAYAFALEAQAGTLERPDAPHIYDFASCAGLIDKQVKSGYRPCCGLRIGPSGKEQCFLPYECLRADAQKAVWKDEKGNFYSIEGYPTTSTIGKTVLGVLFGAAVVWALWTLKPWKRGKKGK